MDKANMQNTKNIKKIIKDKLNLKQKEPKQTKQHMITPFTKKIE